MVKCPHDTNFTVYPYTNVFLILQEGNVFQSCLSVSQSFYPVGGVAWDLIVQGPPPGHVQTCSF